MLRLAVLLLLGSSLPACAASQTPPPNHPHPDIDERIAGLEQRIRELEDEVAYLRRADESTRLQLEALLLQHGLESPGPGSEEADEPPVERFDDDHPIWLGFLGHEDDASRVTDAFRTDVLSNPDMLAQHGRVTVHYRDGLRYGLRLSSIKRTGLFGRLGFKTNDIVLRVNDLRLVSGEQADQLLAVIEGADRLEVEVERRGEPVILVVVVE